MRKHFLPPLSMTPSYIPGSMVHVLFLTSCFNPTGRYKWFHWNASCVSAQVHKLSILLKHSIVNDDIFEASEDISTNLPLVMSVGSVVLVEPAVATVTLTEDGSN